MAYGEDDAIWGSGKWGSFKWGEIVPPEGLIYPSQPECVRFANSQRNIQLCHIINYRIMKKTVVPFHRVASKQSSSPDRNGRTTDPLRVTFRARITNSQKNTLDSMELDREVIDITCGDLIHYYDNYTMESLEFLFSKGNTSLPWIVNMIFMASND